MNDSEAYLKKIILTAENGDEDAVWLYRAEGAMKLRELEAQISELHALDGVFRGSSDLIKIAKRKREIELADLKAKLGIKP